MFNFFSSLRRNGSFISFVVALDAVCLWYLLTICTDAYWSSTLSNWILFGNILAQVMIVCALAAAVSCKEEVNRECFAFSCIAFICLVIAFSSELGEVGYYNTHKSEVEQYRQNEVAIKQEKQRIEAEQQKQKMAIENANHDCYNFASALATVGSNNTEKMVALLKASTNPCVAAIAVPAPPVAEAPKQ